MIVNSSTFTQYFYIYIYRCIAPQPVVAQIMGFCPSNIIVIDIKEDMEVENVDNHGTF